jgi:hypothetical protein
MQNKPKRSSTKKFTLIKNNVLVQKDIDNATLTSFLNWADVSHHIDILDLIKVLKIVVSRELKRKR